MKVKRRTFLAALGVSAVGAAACTPTPAPPVPPPTAPPPSPTPTAWPSRPGDSLSVEAVVFDGAFGTSFVRAAGERLTQRYPGLRVRVEPVTAVATELGPRFTADATPPDLVGNSGADALPISTLFDELLPLDGLLATTDDAGSRLSETLFRTALTAGSVDDRQVALPYVLTVFGLWHSAHRLAAEAGLRAVQGGAAAQQHRGSLALLTQVAGQPRSEIDILRQDDGVGGDE